MPFFIAFYQFHPGDVRMSPAGRYVDLYGQFEVGWTLMAK